ncbi:peptide-methionine (S)-S-oxide reductase [Paramagnetospirillum kuznetsovii]|uniref:Peptide methionine sulfoxide reductase MsrA n=1 Tax=Paramagnetospirillum kuznetsovii TaxID=2053833 RepID=A0A364NVG7_9PROT|nr:peptide-methionine (S)-S-oxide reductase MsrA [Paramagnetospirillum kuznetsovii]RAU21052.1 peptide-methionine (S)-S-oxide reductase [Paramagnetospirillum kuznetsovii]
MALFGPSKTVMVSAAQALPGRDEALPVPERHEVLGTHLKPPFPQGVEIAVFAMGCFWGAERLFWHARGVYSTSVGYAGGFTPNPLYEEVCSARTGHTEAVMVAFQSDVTSYGALLRLFWEGHNPTQGMRQGNDIGTQYRSAILTTTPEQARQALESRDAFQVELTKARFGAITTEIATLDRFYWAESYHQQYLAKNPSGYCGLGGTGIRLG